MKRQLFLHQQNIEEDRRRWRDLRLAATGDLAEFYRQYADYLQWCWKTSGFISDRRRVLLDVAKRAAKELP